VVCVCQGRIIAWNVDRGAMLALLDAHTDIAMDMIAIPIYRVRIYMCVYVCGCVCDGVCVCV